MTNSEQWEAAVVRAGRNSGDLAHPLVYCPELHFSEFISAVADMKNSVAVSGKIHTHGKTQSRSETGEFKRQGFHHLLQNKLSLAHSSRYYQMVGSGFLHSINYNERFIFSRLCCVNLV